MSFIIIIYYYNFCPGRQDDTNECSYKRLILRKAMSIHCSEFKRANPSYVEKHIILVLFAFCEFFKGLSPRKMFMQAGGRCSLGMFLPNESCTPMQSMSKVVQSELRELQLR